MNRRRPRYEGEGKPVVPRVTDGKRQGEGGKVNPRDIYDKHVAAVKRASVDQRIGSVTPTTWVLVGVYGWQ